VAAGTDVDVLELLVLGLLLLDPWPHATDPIKTSAMNATSPAITFRLRSGFGSGVLMTPLGKRKQRRHNRARLCDRSPKARGAFTGFGPIDCGRLGSQSTNIFGGGTHLHDVSPSVARSSMDFGNRVTRPSKPAG
jgi:hypothetical protein